MIFQRAIGWSCRCPHLLVTLVLVGWVLSVAADAHAWSERRVEASTTTIDLAADGAATVRHELVIASHGGPLQTFTLRGVDPDAQPLADATVLRLSGDQAASLPQAVNIRTEDGALVLDVRERRGLRGTSFLLRFGYRTHLAEHGMLRLLPDGQRALLSWVGPRFDEGVDSVTVIVRAPAARLPPEVADSGENESYGAIVSALRRSRERDELELVRAHVARDEAMRWEVQLDAALAGETAAGTLAAAAPRATIEPGSALAPPDAPGVAPDPAMPERRRPRPLDAAGLFGAGVFYAALVWLKARSVARAATLRHATPRAWVAWPAALRALGAGAALAAAATLALFGDPPLLAAVALLVAMAFAAHAAPEREPRVLGPGEWRPVEAAALANIRPTSVPGAWLDAGRLRGFISLAALLAGVVFAASREFVSSPFSGACMLLAGAAFLPIFCTGRARELPVDTLGHSARFLTAVSRQLSRRNNLLVTPIGRAAGANGELEELRLSIAPARPVPGLLGLELGIELLPGLTGPSARPVVIVRAAEGSECQRSLPRGLTWTRGRCADERASLVRPKLPTVTLSAALIQELCEVLLSPPEAADALTKNDRKSSGNGLSTVNAGTRSSPAHAT
jgi:hypothetical protein